MHPSLLNVKFGEKTNSFNSKDYELILFDSLSEMVEQIKDRDKESGLSRLIAGYSWAWISKNDTDVFDIVIDDIKLKWNGTSQDWINSEDSVNEVGCIHTTQGYDLNYSGIIFGNEISYDPESQQILIREDQYCDKNGKQSITDPEELKDFIINIYKTLMLRAIRGTYVYVCDPHLREYFSSFIPKTKKEEAPKLEFYSVEDIKPFLNAIPLYDLKVAAGQFGEMQEVEDVSWVKPPVNIKPNKDLFACQIVGDSMNKIIPDGSVCLFKKYAGGSRNGQIVLVQHTNLQDQEYGSCYTIKEFESRKKGQEGSWEHGSIILKPRSFNDKYQDIILSDDEAVGLQVIGVFECVIE